MEVIYDDGGKITVFDATPRQPYRSQAAKDAQAAGYGTRDYWDYLEETSLDYAKRGIAPLDRPLLEALAGNDGP